MKKAERLLVYIAILILTVAASFSGFYTYKLWVISEEQNPANYSDVPPRNIGWTYDYVADSTVTINCVGGFGSGFSFGWDEIEFDETYELYWKFDLPDSKHEIIITNYHVIENCYAAKDKIEVELPSGKILEARIKKVDPVNDLVALLIKKNLPKLAPITWELYPAHWVMAMGSAFRMTGTVSIGHISNIDGYRIYTSASLNQGNSGGPLVDNEGRVIGVNTGYRALAQDVNWAIDINALCVRIVNCETSDGLIHPIE